MRSRLLLCHAYTPNARGLDGDGILVVLPQFNDKQWKATIAQRMRLRSGIRYVAVISSNHHSHGDGDLSVRVWIHGRLRLPLLQPPTFTTASLYLLYPLLFITFPSTHHIHPLCVWTSQSSSAFTASKGRSIRHRDSCSLDTRQAGTTTDPTSNRLKHMPPRFHGRKQDIDTTKAVWRRRYPISHTGAHVAHADEVKLCKHKTAPAS